MTAFECRVGLDPNAVQLDEPGAVRSQALGLSSVFSRIHLRSVTVQGIWHGLGPHYVAPEQGLVLAAMDTPVTESETLQDKGNRVRTALDTFADRLEELRARRAQLVADVDAFYADKARIEAENENNRLHNDIWDAITGEAEDLYHREQALNERIAQLQADKDAAERECANAIGDIWGADHYEAAGETWATDETVYGMTADGYVALSESGDAPWGVVTMWSSGNVLVKATMFFEGAGDSITGSLSFLGDLTGLNGAGRAQAAYSGLGMLAKDAWVAGSPLAYFVTTEEERAAARSSMLEVGKAMIGWDTWDTTGYKTAGGLGLDVLLGIGTGGGALALKGGVRAGSAALRSGVSTRLPSLLPSGGRLNIGGLRSAAMVRLDNLTMSLGGPRLAMATPGGSPGGGGWSMFGGGGRHQVLDNPARDRMREAQIDVENGRGPTTGGGQGGPDTSGGSGHGGPETGGGSGSGGLDTGGAGGHGGGTGPGTPDLPDPPSGPTHDAYGRQYVFDDAGRRHLDGDPQGTYRDAGGRLRDERGWVTDPNRPPESDLVKAVHDPVDAHHASDIAADQAYQDLVGERRALQTEHLDALHRRDQLAGEMGVDPKQLNGKGAEGYIDELVQDGRLTESQAAELTDAVRAEATSLTSLRSTSESLGEEAMREVMARRGEEPLFGPVGEPGARGSQVGRFDGGSLSTGEPPTLRLYEAKGGGSGLGSRVVDGGPRQQGTTAYLREILEKDPRVVESLRSYLARADADPGTVSAIRNGTLKVEYDLVRALPGGSVKISRFRLDISELRDLPGLSDLFVDLTP